MFVYIDESIESGLFVMGAILVEDDRDAWEPVELTKRYIKKLNRNITRVKNKIQLTELKDTVRNETYTGYWHSN